MYSGMVNAPRTDGMERQTDSFLPALEWIARLGVLASVDKKFFRKRPELGAQRHELPPVRPWAAGQDDIASQVVAPNIDLFSVKAKFGWESHRLAAPVAEKLGCLGHDVTQIQM
jgi:hypothetical protein